jgi:hypothetical protein
MTVGTLPLTAASGWLMANVSPPTDLATPD